MSRIFRDRTEAGQLLAGKLGRYANRNDVVVLALPRGGVPVGLEVARRLGAALDVFVVRKLGVPGHEELAMGAIATGGVRVLNQDVIAQLGISDEVIDAVAAEEKRELERRQQAYRNHRRPPEVAGRVVILVDDGVATGSTMEAAVLALRQLKPARIVVAVPTAPPSSVEALRGFADEVVAVMTPDLFYGVGQWYADFAQTSDAEVRDLLKRSELFAAPPSGP
jgi:predicted phosphoribosyltransferase